MTLCTKFQFTTQTNKQGICKEKNLFIYLFIDSYNVQGREQQDTQSPTWFTLLKAKAVQLSFTNQYFHPYRIFDAVKTYHKLVQKVSALLWLYVQAIVALHGCFDILKLTT